MVTLSNTHVALHCQYSVDSMNFTQIKMNGTITLIRRVKIRIERRGKGQDEKGLIHTKQDIIVYLIDSTKEECFVDILIKLFVINLLTFFQTSNTVL